MQKKVLANDLLTTAEIEKMIITAAKIRDKAIIAVLAESGCRAGELISCRVKDVEFTGDSLCRLTFPKGKTGSRTVPLVFAASYIDHYLRRKTGVNGMDWHMLRFVESSGMLLRMLA